jgi:hypothetical protein
MHGIVEDFYTLLDNSLYEKWGVGEEELKELLVNCVRIGKAPRSCIMGLAALRPRRSMGLTYEGLAGLGSDKYTKRRGIACIGLRLLGWLLANMSSRTPSSP